MIYTAEITYFDSTITKTAYYSTCSFVTKTTDTPASKAFYPQIIDQGSIGINLFSDGQTFGASKLSIGELIIDNTHGTSDSTYISEGAAGGYPVVIRMGEAGAAYPAGFTTVFSGTCAGVDFGLNTIVIRLKDASYVFDQNFLSVTYDGTNALPSGIEGTEDIKGDYKPQFYGKIFNATPTFVNTSKLIYQLTTSTVASIDNVYDRGVALTFNANNSSQATLEAAVIAAGDYNTCTSLGLFRLGSSPDGLVTCDATRSTAGNNKIAVVINSIVIASGLTVNSSDKTALDTACPYEAGIYITGDRTRLSLLDELAESCGIYYYIDNTGVFRYGVLPDFYSLSPVASFTDSSIYSIVDRSGDHLKPAWRVNVNYYQNETVQTSDIATSVTMPRKTFLAKKFRTVYTEDTATKTNYKDSRIITINSRLTTEADANTERTRVFNLYALVTRMYEVEIPAELFTFTVSQAISIQSNYHSISADCIVMGYYLDLKNDKVKLTLWSL